MVLQLSVIVQAVGARAAPPRTQVQWSHGGLRRSKRWGVRKCTAAPEMDQETVINATIWAH